jgi:xanthine dehydrogenase large subunit
MDIRLWDAGENVEPTIHRSKAVGEPPFMLANSVFSALTEAVMAVRPEAVRLGPARAGCPATPERVLAALAELRAR